MAETASHVVGRVGALLRAVGAVEPTGASTTELARATSLARPSAHRLLVSLAEEGMVDRDPRSGRWSLGPELYLLGTAAAGRYDVTDQARDVVGTLARETGESAFLSTRRGDETVCILAEDGSFPLRSHVLYEGKRFPLGVASAGLAILTHLPDREIDEYFSRYRVESGRDTVDSESVLRERIESTRRTGYSVNPGLVVEGSWGLGAAVFDAAGRPAWALSLTGVENRFTPTRRPELGALLLEHAHSLSTRLASSGRR